MSKTEDKLRDIVGELLADGKVDFVIGYEQGSLPLQSRPCRIRDAADADHLVWNQSCRGNLAVFLTRFLRAKPVRPGQEAPPLPVVGVVAKSCDLRSTMGLVNEHQVPRENVVIIGMPCTGQLSPDKVQQAAGGEVIECTRTSDTTVDVVTASGTTVSLDSEDVLAQACLECRYPAPGADCADVIVEGESRAPAEDDYAAVRDFQALSPEERRAAFAAELAKCIRCDACRQACPSCYCTSCFADQTKPRWVTPGDALDDVMLFHMGRIFHQAGRCVECDACVYACPMGVDLRPFTRQLAMDAKELYGCVPGLEAGELPALCVFKEDDSESFITES